MFDVSWNDPGRETVGQRKVRKEQEQDHSSVPPDIKRRPSVSSDASKSKHRPAFLTLLNNSRKDVSRPASDTDTISQRKEARSEPSLRRPGGGNIISPIQELPAGALTMEKLLDTFVVTELSVRDFNDPVDELSFAKWASRPTSIDSRSSSGAESSRKNDFMQPLSPTSFITQRTEVTVASREDIKESDHNITVVHISADSQEPIITQDQSNQISQSSSTSELQAPELRVPETHTDEKYIRTNLFQHTSSKSPNNNRWKPPEDWECPAIPVLQPKSSARLPWRPNIDDKNLSVWNVTQMQKTIKRMRTASTKIMLDRLREEWSDLGDGEVDEEFEFERLLWMRTALKACIKMSRDEMSILGDKGADESVPKSPKVTKILSLHQDQASLALLATHNNSPAIEVHHLSSNTAFPLPTIYTLTVPSPNAQLSYGTSIFSAIHMSLSLPTFFASPALPPLLKECHRILLPLAPLHLTLIDPCPTFASTGPKLRTWLDANLLLELERKFRCTNPCRLVPGWLADVGFQGPPVVKEGLLPEMEIARFRFSAAPGRLGHKNVDVGAALQQTNDELRDVVGKGLWEECWGGFCVGGNRWWDDAEVMQECIEMETVWEVVILEARKGRDSGDRELVEYVF